MHDELVAKNRLIGDIEYIKTPLLRDKKVFLIRGKENYEKEKKSYLRTLLVMIDNELVTSTYADTVLFFTELKLFDQGNAQNRFFSVERIQNMYNLKFESEVLKKVVYISKAEADACRQIYFDSKTGVSMARILEDEFVPDIETLFALFDDEE